MDRDLEIRRLLYTALALLEGKELLAALIPTYHLRHMTFPGCTPNLYGIIETPDDKPLVLELNSKSKTSWELDMDSLYMLLDSFLQMPKHVKESPIVIHTKSQSIADFVQEMLDIENEEDFNTFMAAEPADEDEAKAKLKLRALGEKIIILSHLTPSLDIVLDND
jgi:hypothetical protein